MSFERLGDLCTQLPADIAAAWSEPLTAAAEEFGILSDAHQAMWVATLCHESTGFTHLIENMNYSAQRLAEVWPDRYAIDAAERPLKPNAHALYIGGRPEMIASDVYGNRMGNGPPVTRDGWRYRGRYPSMMTGKRNYVACNYDIGIPDINDPDLLLRDLPGMARVAGWFWQHNNLSFIADSIGGFRAVSQIWNYGGLSVNDPIGWVDRQNWFRRAVALNGGSEPSVA